MTHARSRMITAAGVAIIKRTRHRLFHLKQSLSEPFFMEKAFLSSLYAAYIVDSCIFAASKS
jgi:hypothetical protein